MCVYIRVLSRSNKCTKPSSDRSTVPLRSLDMSMETDSSIPLSLAEGSRPRETRLDLRCAPLQIETSTTQKKNIERPRTLRGVKNESEAVTVCGGNKIPGTYISLRRF